MEPVKRGRTILVATDGSEAARAALRVAIDLAEASGDKLILVAVWHELRADFGIPLFKLIPDLVDIPREWAAKTLAAEAAEATAAGLEVETRSRYGTAAREICTVARELRPRLIVIGSTGWGSIDGALFGSVSRAIVHHAPSPVLLVPIPEELQAPPTDTETAVATSAGSRATDPKTAGKPHPASVSPPMAPLPVSGKLEPTIRGGRDSSARLPRTRRKDLGVDARSVDRRRNGRDRPDRLVHDLRHRPAHPQGRRPRSAARHDPRP